MPGLILRHWLSPMGSNAVRLARKTACEGWAFSAPRRPGTFGQPSPKTRTGGATARRRGPYLRSGLTILWEPGDLLPGQVPARPARQWCPGALTVPHSRRPKAWSP